MILLNLIKKTRLVHILIPSPNRAIVTNANQNIPVPIQTRLSYRRRAARMLKRVALRQRRIAHIQIPNEDLPRLISQREYLLPEVHRESNEPNLALLVIEAMDDGGACLPFAELLVLQPARFPAHDAILARFTQDKVAEPSDAVHVIAVDVPR